MGCRKGLKNQEIKDNKREKLHARVGATMIFLRLKSHATRESRSCMKKGRREETRVREKRARSRTVYVYIYIYICMRKEPGKREAGRHLFSLSLFLSLLQQYTKSSVQVTLMHSGSDAPSPTTSRSGIHFANFLSLSSSPRVRVTLSLFLSPDPSLPTLSPPFVLFLSSSHLCSATREVSRAEPRRWCGVSAPPPPASSSSYLFFISLSHSLRVS